MSMFAMLMMVRVNYYIATVWPQARYLLGDEDGEKVNHLFDVALPRKCPLNGSTNPQSVESFPCPLSEHSSITTQLLSSSVFSS